MQVLCEWGPVLWHTGCQACKILSLSLFLSLLHTHTHARIHTHTHNSTLDAELKGNTWQHTQFYFCDSKHTSLSHWHMYVLLHNCHISPTPHVHCRRSPWHENHIVVKMVKRYHGNDADNHLFLAISQPYLKRVDRDVHSIVTVTKCTLTWAHRTT